MIIGLLGELDDVIWYSNGLKVISKYLIMICFLIFMKGYNIVWKELEKIVLKMI